MAAGREKIKVYLLSLGCDKNLVDSEIMLGLLRDAGCVIVPDPEEAGVIVVNTCGFIESAVSEGIETILTFTPYKTAGSCRVLVVTGCMAQRYREKILEEIPEVDAVIGVNDFPRIAEVIQAIWTTPDKVVHFSGTTADTDWDALYQRRLITAPMHVAYLKIAEGCDNHCAYCTIPQIRGAYRSRSMESLLAEARALAAQGAKELVLVAQDTARYGIDRYGAPRLHELLYALAEIESLAWIRVLYAYPENITPELIKALTANEKICRYLDMPVQHSHDAVLQRMGRTRSTNAGLRALVEKLRADVPGIALRTTLMVGFPGETEAEFENLQQFVQDMRFDRLGVFAYSKEDGTRAAGMRPQVKQAVKQERKRRLMLAQKAISAEKLAARVGETVTVMVDGRITEATGELERYCGRTYQDAYEIDGFVSFSSDNLLMSGDWVTVRLTAAGDYDLDGVLN